jgi:hypothetical protein
MNHYKFYYEKKTIKTQKKIVFYCKLLFIIVSHNYIEEVRSLEKSSSLFLFIFKNSIFLKKYLFLENLK